MFRKALAIALFHLLAATVLLAQSAEYGRTSGGEIEGIVKRPSTFSGSFGLGLSSNAGRSYLATAGGTLVKDKMWFFASADANRAERIVPNVSRTVPTLTFGDITAHLSDSQMFKATAIPSSFLSLHYTGIVSPNMFFSATVTNSRQAAGVPAGW